MMTFLLLIKKILRIYNRAKTIQKAFPTLKLEDNVVIKGDLKNLRLGKNVIIQSGTVLNAGGMDWCHNQGYIEIGDNSVISPNCIIYGCGPGGVRIGKSFDCGPGVGIFSSRTNYLSGPGKHIFKPVNIGNEVTIFANAVISPGISIGDKAVIAACSVVLTDVPPNCLVGGSPARILKENIKK